MSDHIETNSLYVTRRNLYLSGRTREIWEVTKLRAEEDGDIPPDQLVAFFAEFEETLMTRRNRSWAETLAGLTEGTKAFVAVGALHLSGEDGVLRLLEETGFEVERIGL